MTSDLLFSILPREAKVPIAHDTQKVVKIGRQKEQHALTDEEKELQGKASESRKMQQQGNKNKTSTEQDPHPDKVAQDVAEVEHKKPKGPKHLDIYV